MSANSPVLKTRAGLFLREEDRGVAYVFSPHTGLLFALRSPDTETVKYWLRTKGKVVAPSVEFLEALGPGWAIPMKKGRFPKRHLLQSGNAPWPELRPERPLLINWFLTGHCQLDCIYCYARDLMNGKCQEPDAATIKANAKAILSYAPLAVVLTGGDPSASPFLELSIKSLLGKTGIMVDTNGFNLTPEHISLFKKYGVFVRISLDSEVPGVNQRLRPTRKGIACVSSTASAAVSSICACLDVGIPVGVQTVVTKTNQGDLASLFDKLERLGVACWRVMLEAPTTHTIKGVARRPDCSRVSSKRFREHILSQLHIKQAQGRDRSMSIQFTDNNTANAVILVSPDGRFFTESSMSPGKVLIDDHSPRHPSNRAILRQVDMHAHAHRYLNIHSG